MALDNKFRVSELAQSGSRAIISEDPISKTHTFIDGSTTIVSQSATEPYEHIEGERDGELTNYIEKPKYDETQLKKAVDTVIDELIVPPLPPSPPVVPKPVYDDLLERYNQSIADLAEANTTIRNLQAQIAQLQGQIQSLLSQLDAAQVARAIAENQLQQQATAFGELTGKFSQAIIKGTKEASARVSLQAQVEGLTAQKDTLREQILQLRQIVASLQGQVAAQLDILDTQQDAARKREEDAKQRIEDLKNQAEEDLAAAEAANLVREVDILGPEGYRIFDGGKVGIYIDSAKDVTKIGEANRWNADSGMLRWRAGKTFREHLNGGSGDSAVLKIKSISTQPEVIELVGSTIVNSGYDAKTGNKGVKNLDTQKPYGPFVIQGARSSWSIPQAQEIDGVVKTAISGPNIGFGIASDINNRTGGTHNAGGVGYYTFRLKSNGSTVKVPWSALQVHADRK
jgi:hypothetical protein